MLALFSAVWVMVVMAELRVELMSLSMLVTECCTALRLSSSFLTRAKVPAEKLTEETAIRQRKTTAAVFHFLFMHGSSFYRKRRRRCGRRSCLFQKGNCSSYQKYTGF